MTTTNIYDILAHSRYNGKDLCASLSPPYKKEKNCLLIVRPLRGRMLDCWLTGGERYIVPAPTFPYFYDFEPVTRTCELVTRRLLSDVSKQLKLYKCFCGVEQVQYLRTDHSLECDVRFVERLAIDYGFSHSYAQAKPLKTLAFDDEMFSLGQFPNPKRDPVTAIGVWSNSVQRVLVGDELEILDEFVNIVERENPDILFTYSGTALDYWYPLQRAHLRGLRFPLGRLGDEPRIVEKKFGKFRREREVYLHGRICMDVYKEVRIDPFCQGMRHDLKTVARHFFSDDRDLIREVDRTEMYKLSEDELYEYCLSDARVTYKLGMHYLDVLLNLAYLLRVPLDFIVYRSPSHIGNVVYGRAMKERGIVSDGANYDRFKGVLFS